MLRLYRKLVQNNKIAFNFCSQIQKAEIKKDEVPVHLRPYDRQKYEVPSTKLKYSSGYALLDVDPMPRSTIMKISYNLLERLKEVPEHAMYRIYTEEKVKYIMKLTDEVEDIKTLEEEFGHESIEIFIQCYKKELQLVDYMKSSKPWESRPDDLEENENVRLASQKRVGLKHQRLDKPEREQVQFIGEKQKQ
ncbi:hypothetical protein IMG5_147480 [Ichthyophthirius multifiliis]|uniref:Uncharacterized protein n=1 Tax=Ichthyophthirius multifiliis TaxID=5932 RepID=G0QY52_ICHMU|nr:hypothetical protein IMG5_147480 [Ichthyophthirius multifiliis]EGR29849.1 hypothetical protein IMG5_147480 [Ichthyophthirius multifiliis]|eukprot:XP_004031085.1 hypothetical protein IMG5_147480 [Ichthyophthirius multifiliis]